MRCRIMRLLVFFDLPTLTAKDRSNYRQFRKELINEGFLMLQNSVYVRIGVDKQAVNFLEKRLQQVAPKQGVIQTLIITEKQYTNINFLTGTAIKDIKNSDERLLII